MIYALFSFSFFLLPCMSLVGKTRWGKNTWISNERREGKERVSFRAVNLDPNWCLPLPSLPHPFSFVRALFHLIFKFSKPILPIWEIVCRRERIFFPFGQSFYGFTACLATVIRHFLLSMHWSVMQKDLRTLEFHFEEADKDSNFFPRTLRLQVFTFQTFHIIVRNNFHWMFCTLQILLRVFFREFDNLAFIRRKFAARARFLFKYLAFSYTSHVRQIRENARRINIRTHTLWIARGGRAIERNIVPANSHISRVPRIRKGKKLLRSILSRHRPLLPSVLAWLGENKRIFCPLLAHSLDFAETRVTRRKKKVLFLFEK